MQEITFTLPFAYKLPNRTIGQHWGRATREKNDLMRKVAAEAYHLRPAQPFRKARVVIERHGVREPDTDNLVAGMKRLLDCLTTPVMQQSKSGRPSVKNKRGLGFVVDDSPEFITLEVKHVKSKRDEQKTVVTITEID